MGVLFEVMKGLFLLVSLLVGIVVLRGNILFGSAADMIQLGLVPAYLVLCGIMIAYISMYIIRMGYDDDELPPSLQIKGFVSGAIFGSILAATYVLL